MPEKRELPFFPLRAFLEFDSAYNMYVCRCLETGTVVTADEADTAWEMLKEVIEDEIEFAVEHKNLTNLFSTPAPTDVWTKWYNRAKHLREEKKELETVYISVNAKELRLDDGEVSGEISMVRAVQ